MVALRNLSGGPDELYNNLCSLSFNLKLTLQGYCRFSITGKSLPKGQAHIDKYQEGGKKKAAKMKKLLNKCMTKKRAPIQSRKIKNRCCTVLHQNIHHKYWRLVFPEYVSPSAPGFQGKRGILIIFQYTYVCSLFWTKPKQCVCMPV